MSDCAELSYLLADHVRGRLAGEPSTRVTEHLEGCPTCRATARALTLVRQASEGGGSDLWPRLSARRAAAEPDGAVVVSFPPLTWQAAAALAAVVLVLVVAGDVRLVALALGTL
jgi:predicted anti-sigma-YlaC factor YlaD